MVAFLMTNQNLYPILNLINNKINLKSILWPIPIQLKKLKKSFS